MAWRSECGIIYSWEEWKGRQNIGKSVVDIGVILFVFVHYDICSLLIEDILVAKRWYEDTEIDFCGNVWTLGNRVII